ncbi:MAG: RluA family pseudouridine synthase [Spirochaetales bacterium]|nr:RluA family pseudouridine synthase [Spirochaetales bacterium]
MTQTGPEKKQFTVSETQRDVRLDFYLADIAKLCTRSQIKTRTADIAVNGKKAKLSRKIKAGDVIALVYKQPPPLELVPEKMELRILYEDDSVIVINKPQGLVVHPGAGNPSGTLVNGLLAHCTRIQDSFKNHELRPGIVHRLDKDTSGVIITAKHPDALEFLSRQFRLRTTRKRYIALVNGKLPQKTGIIVTAYYRDRKNRKKFACAEIDAGRPFRGKIAETHYKVISEWDSGSLVALTPHTGRTHQLRVHMRSINCPVIGDPIYGKQSGKEKHTLMLHAWKLKIRLPGEKKQKVFTAPIPQRFKKVVDKFSRSL